MDAITFPHYSKECLQLIRYALFNDQDYYLTRHIFRAGLLSNECISWSPHYRSSLFDADAIVIEIASTKAYKIYNSYAHHIALDAKYGSNHMPIQSYHQSYDEVYNDLLRIKCLLNKPTLLVGHLVTRPYGSRYELSLWLKSIAANLNWAFLDPVSELQKISLDTSKFFSLEATTNHYSQEGEYCIGGIYRKYIAQAVKQFYGI